MTSEQRVKERIENDLKDHVVTLLHSDGMYRHWRCAKPGCWNMGFNIVTWPGSLCFTGDMEQVAERLRKVRLANEISNEAHTKACDDVYGFGDNYGALLHDESEAIDDWLAERDPAPLTVEVMQSFGATVRNVIADMPRLSFVLTIDGKWLCHTHSVVISTVGELRTLARLAGVELKKGGE